jgi:hypothetical protein
MPEWRHGSKKPNCPPVCWGINTERKLAFFNMVREVTVAELPGQVAARPGTAFRWTSGKERV